MTQSKNTLVPDSGAGACSLAPDMLDTRVGAWRSLTELALNRQAAPGRILGLYPNTPEIARRLSELIKAEEECCQFLQFDVQERDTVLQVELRYPPEFEPLLAAVLDEPVPSEATHESTMAR